MKKQINTKKRDIFLTIDLVFATLTLILGTIFAIHSTHSAEEDKIIALKACASSGFVIVAVSNLVYALLEKKNKVFPILMTCAFGIGAIADVVLFYQFMVGGVLFAIGHILFIIAFSFLYRYTWKDILCGLAIFIPLILVIFFTPVFSEDLMSKPLNIAIAVGYGLLVSLVVGKAIGNTIVKANKLNLFILVGSILFLIGDILLLIYKFQSESLASKFTLNSCIAYYPAQIALAMSMFMYVIENKAGANK